MKHLLPILLALLLILTSCHSSAGPKYPAPDPDAENGELAVGIPYGYKTYRYNGEMSYGLAAKWENRPYGKLTVNFCAMSSNRVSISMTLTDSEDRHMASTGRLAPGQHITEIQLTGIPAQTEEICVTIYGWSESGELLYTVSRYENLIRSYK